ncbi:transketolase C-terminal domain-containing protein [Chelativorans sp. Marseille-P2723]|uniref:transketolase C-terminal domain-containing protein n=1 Tax=Chelativorans sp. Marseille-P2723 TaxID=2709133 RepID=UPI00156FD094|nr:transketolase C-terminal domain-containing protein [Chelativorans sp. Marseille-P2723]
MAPKPGTYAILEAVQHEMRAQPHLTFWWQSSKPVAVSPMGQVIDLFAEFGDPRVPFGTAINEEWYIGAAAGAAMSGVPTIARTPSMTPVRAFDLVFNQIGKLRHMTGGQAHMPLVIWQDGAGRAAGPAGQHADAGQESLYAALPGVKVVVPADPYDAKGLMHASLRDPDPVIFFHYAEINGVRVDVPDEAYEVKIGEAITRQEGNDITIVGYGPAAVEINRAVEGLKEAGISAEIIDPRSLKPLPMDTILQSVRKTGRLLAVDHGHETLCGATEIIARCAIGVPGAKFARLAFPDAPPPGARRMIEWMRPDAPKIVEAARKLVAA